MNMIIILLLTTIPLFAWLIPYLQKRMVIKHWYNSHAINKHQNNYQKLFRDINGFALSRQARATGDAIEYTYGEIDFVPFIALLSLVKPHINTVFYDLGSGTGKAVLACAMVFNVKKSCGIELFNALHQTALKQQQHLQQLPDYDIPANTIQFLNADFLDVDFSEATLIFMNATAFFGETWITNQQCLLKLNPGTIVITTSKKLSLDIFRIIKTTTVQMSWGPVRAYVQQRI